jgi:hypothetical protein
MSVKFPDSIAWPGVDYVPKPPSPPLYGVLPDGRNPEWDFRPRPVAPDPAVNRTGGIDDYKKTMRRSPFLAAWQWFDMDLLSLAMYGKLYKDLTKTQQNFILGKFKGLYAGNAFITNGAGVDTCNCYPCGGADARRGKEPKIDSLIMAYKPGSPRGGLQVLEVRENAKGVDMARINGFRWNSTPPPPNLNDPRVGWATTIEANGNVSNFGHLEGKPVPYAIIQFEPCWYPLRGLERI